MQTLLIISTVLLWALVLLNLLFTLNLARRLKSALPVHDYLKIGQKAPDFTVLSTKGEAVTLSTYMGRAAAFVFMSPNCEPCLEKLPELMELTPKAKQLGIEISLVSDVDNQEALPFIKVIGDSLPVLLAPRYRTPFLKDYKVYAFPSFYLIDSVGKVYAASDGISDLEGSIEALSRDERR